MTEVFVDSNVFLRFYAGDDTEQGKTAEAIFVKAKNGGIKLLCGPPVFFEVAWTLKAWAKWPNDRILETLKAMTAVPNMTLLDEEIVVHAIALAQETGQEFADSYIAAAVRTRGARLATFNRKHFAKLGVPLYRGVDILAAENALPEVRRTGFDDRGLDLRNTGSS
ncbi:MAG: PIN domain-containing protein [Synergistaceae bacterium]|jgi:predicted nucleic acid-binding protein|nr:PIN domain-containing protein [Synergistaceae bacterium]